MDVKAGRRRRIWRGESRPFKTSATEECNSQYHTAKINEYVRQQVDIFAGYHILLSVVKRRKLSWFSHVCRHNTLTKSIQGTVDGSRRT